MAYLQDEGRVLKIADVHALATESLYDYLTDLLLCNCFFDYDLQMVGCYEEGGRLHLVISQPYVNGTHPDWTERQAGVVAQGMRGSSAPGPKAETSSSITMC